MTAAINGSTSVESATDRAHGWSVLRRFGWNEGDAWTVGIGVVLATALAVTTIPAALDARDGAANAIGPVEPPALVEPPPVVVPVPSPSRPREPQGLLDPLVPAPTSAPSTSAPTLPSPAPTPNPPPDLPVAIPPGAVRAFAPVDGGQPGAVAAGPDGTVYAATDTGTGPSRLYSWDATGTRTGASTVPEQPSDRARGMTSLVAAADGRLLGTDAATGRILRYDPALGTWAVLARLPDLVTCLLPTDTPCQPGLADTAPLPRGIAVDPTGTAYVADAGQGVIWRLRPGQPLEVWYSSADVVGTDGLAGLALDGNGHLLVAVTRLADLQGTGAGALLRIERAADGTAGTRSVVATFAAGDDPADVAVGATGNLFVVLRGANALVVLDNAGGELLRVDDNALRAPVAVELVAGRVYVAVGGSRPAVLAVGTLDRPALPRR